ncbi:hypothetical protein B7494_g7729 [Chlorociboria aeruginascens]|nr:hypothetical protein B7494_g7729 [Chlorociboria aeruginascens]
MATPETTLGIELINQSMNDGQEESQSEIGPEQSLPRADGGKHAYLFLAGGFIIEALVWGFPFSFGIFEEYYSTHVPFSEHVSGIPAIGTTATGIMYLGSPLAFTLLQRYPRSRNLCASIGFLIMTCALIGASFAQTVTHLIVTQGTFFGIGGLLLYSPVVSFVDEWFIKRKGLAYGVMWAGGGASGLVLPFVLSWSLTSYGFRTTLRIWTVVFVLLAGPFTYFVKPRLPISRTSTPRQLSFTFLTTTTFWILQSSNIIQGLGYFIPSIYLPSYARALGYSKLTGSITISLLNSTSIIAVIIMGFLIDYLHVTTVIVASCLGAAISVFLLWGLSSSVSLLYLFSLSYGLSAGGFAACFLGIVKEVKLRSPAADTGVVFGFVAAGRGIGSVVSGPLSASLLESVKMHGGIGGYGTAYSVLIVFTGVTSFLGTVSFVGRRAKII